MDFSIFEQNNFEKIVKKICGSWKISLNIDSFTLKEDIPKKETVVNCIILFKNKTNNKLDIKGRGKGIVDALYQSLVQELSEKYSSLKTFKFIDFIISANELNKSKLKTSGSDSSVTCSLTIANSHNFRYTISHTAFSMNAAAVKVVLKAIEFFINAEIATLKTYNSIKDAQKRNRGDLVERYSKELSSLVQITSYEKLLKG